MRFVFAVPLWLWPLYAIAWIAVWAFIILVGVAALILYVAGYAVVWLVVRAIGWYTARQEG
jgi:hypothetical protein